MTEQLTLDEARAARDDALAQVEANADDQDRAVIDQAIATFAERGVEFSSNDLRDLLPNVRRPLVGARFLAARKRGVIQPVGYTPSTEPSTHAHPVRTWKGVRL